MICFCWQGGGQPPPHPASPEPQQPPFNHMRTEPVSPTGNRISSVSSSPESQRAQKSLATHYLSDSQDFEFDSPPTKSLGGLAGDPSATNGYAVRVPRASNWFGFARTTSCHSQCNAPWGRVIVCTRPTRLLRAPTVSV